MHIKDVQNELAKTAHVAETIELYEKRVVQWANDRNLIKGSTSLAQFQKFEEEAGELYSSLSAGKDPIDDIGDCLVVLTIIAEQQGLTLLECIAHAYNDIKDRKGKMVAGIFVKET